MLSEVCGDYGDAKVDVSGEKEHLYVDQSAVLAGRIYSTKMSQGVAGKKFGGINEVGSVHFALKKSEISELERVGLVPMANEYTAELWASQLRRCSMAITSVYKPTL